MTIFIVLLVLGGPLLVLVGQVVGCVVAFPVVVAVHLLRALVRWVIGRVVSAFHHSHA